MFADDTNLLISAHNPNDLTRRMNCVVSMVSHWFLSNQLLMNASKSSVLKFTPSTLTYCPFNLIHNDQVLSEQDIIKFLGLHLDRHLSWETHLNNLLTKLGLVCFIMRKLSHVLNTESLRIVHFPHFQSLILYGLIFWGTLANMKRVVWLQKRIMIMLGLWPRCSCRSWFKKLDILLVTCLYIYSLMSFVADNQDLFQANSSVTCIKTRQREQLHKPFVALSCIQKGVTFSSIKIFNALPRSLVKLKNEKFRFKHALRRYLKYHSFYTLEEFFSSNSNIIL
jgi:hypothetical protein